MRLVVRIEEANDKLDRVFRIGVPCELSGDRAGKLAAELAAGDPVLIEGQLAYRGATGMLGVWCRRLQQLAPVARVEALDEGVPF